MEKTAQVMPAPESPAETIARLERELAQARLALEDFTYSVSHDLRASLRHVNAYLQIAREDLGDELDPQVAAHLDTAADSAAQMGRLMDGLMEMSRIGRAELQWGAVDMARLVDDLRQQAAHDGASRTSWRVAPDLPQVHGDIALIGKLMDCLIANAIKFSAGRADAEIDISWQVADDGLCELHVQDNGVGFDPRLQDRMFRVFQRLHASAQFEGLGVGLALARRIVERHGGRIRARGAPGQGCCVSLCLPLWRPA